MMHDGIGLLEMLLASDEVLDLVVGVRLARAGMSAEGFQLHQRTRTFLQDAHLSTQTLYLVALRLGLVSAEEKRR